MAKYFNRSIYKYHIDDQTTRTDFETTSNEQAHNIIIFEDFDRIATIVKLMSNDRDLNRFTSDDKKIKCTQFNNGEFIPEHLKILQTAYEDEKDTKARETKYALFKKEYLAYQSETREKLDLQCLLNVIDGVQEHPGRIMIFTCNHPDRLDSAFLRPGRMDYILEFKKCNHQMLSDILHHYYKAENVSNDSKLDTDNHRGYSKLDISRILEYKYSAAEVLSICKMYQHPKQVIKHLLSQF